MLTDAEIAAYLPTVRKIAKQMCRKWSGNVGAGMYNIDDLVSYGCVGLMSAACRFDPDDGRPFEAFAHFRVRGAMIDGMRKMGRLGRHFYELAVKDDRYHGLLAQMDPCDSNTVVDSIGTPEERLARKREVHKLMRVIEGLPEEKRAMIKGYYFEGRKLNDIGKDCGAGQQTMSARKHYALEQIKQQMEE